MGKILSIKIQKAKGQECIFKNKINMEDYQQLALLMNDLESNGAPISKAISKFKKGGEGQFPW